MTVAFSEDYFEARDRFRAAATRAGASLESLEITATADGRPLTCEVATLGEGPNALVVSSGIHGVEGFCGSALQQALLEDPPTDLRVVLIHALNPYGMAERRRVNESNVDLNRNFIGTGAYEGASAGYEMLHPLLNPATPYRGTDTFLLKALAQIARHGFNTLKQATTEGQYKHPKGLFFGGSRLETGPAKVLDAMKKVLAGANRIVQLDVHTGLGRSGHPTLLLTGSAEPGALAEMTRRLGVPVQPWQATGGVAYSIRGAYGDAAREAIPQVDYTFLTVEFGTASPLSVITALRAENQATHWGGDLALARTQLLRTFYPDEAAWRRSVLDKGGALLRALATMARP